MPSLLRERDRLSGIGEAVRPDYERVCFTKDNINQPPFAAFLCPGHPLLDATLDVMLEYYRDLMKRGAVLVDEAGDMDEIRALFYLEQAVQDGRQVRNGRQQVISQRLQFIEVTAAGATRDASPAPYLNYRPITDAERALIAERLAADWLTRDLEAQVMAHAVTQLVPRHVEEVRARRLPEIDKVEYAVTDRLKREIIYWDHRAATLKAQERAGKQARFSSAKAAARALSFEPRDVSAERIGYDIESRDSTSGRLRFIEVKGRMADADTVTVIRNEILTALNKPEAFILAIVQVADGVARAPRYIREPFTREPDYGATSVNYRYGGHKRN